MVIYVAIIFLYRKRSDVGKSIIYILFLFDKLIICGIDFSNIL